MPDGGFQLHTHQAIPGLSVATIANTRASYSRHLHENLTIGLITAGSDDLFHRGAFHHCGAGTLCVIPAQEVHAGEPIEQEPRSFASFTIPSEHLTSTNDPRVSRSLQFAEGPLSDPYLAKALRSLLIAIRNQCDALAVEQGWVSARERLFRLGGAEPANAAVSSTLPPAIKLAREELDMTSQRPPSLEELALGAGLSRFQFLRQFSRHVGLSPYAYNMQKRLEAARKMVVDGVALVDVAARTGFADQAHLTRCFRKHFAIPPGRLKPR